MTTKEEKTGLAIMRLTFIGGAAVSFGSWQHSFFAGLFIFCLCSLYVGTR